MARYYQGLFKPKNPKKYWGDPSNIVYRSSWELKAFMRLDENDSVKAWASEELAIPYTSPVDMSMHRYFVDLIVQMQDGTTYLLEIKPESQTRPPMQHGKTKQRYLKEVMTWGINESKWRAAERFAAQRGWVFKVLTERELGISF